MIVLAGQEEIGRERLEGVSGRRNTDNIAMEITIK